MADSVDSRGNRITTMKLVFPRIVLSEFNTHRMFSRNSASSRAIPFKKMVERVREDPFIPIAFQKHHTGMQGTEYLEGMESMEAELAWKTASLSAIRNAKNLNDDGVTKQLVNRLLEPFQWMETLVTATEFDNFFELRCPKYQYKDGLKIYKSKNDLINSWKTFEVDMGVMENSWWRSINKSQAEIHIQELAECMWDAMNESEPKKLEDGEWHIPFGDNIEVDDSLRMAVATARCARISYLTHDGKSDYQKDIDLHDMLLEAKHASPFEHCAQVMTDDEYVTRINGEVIYNEEVDHKDHVSTVVIKDDKPLVKANSKAFGWSRNFRGFKQYREIVKL